MSRAVVHFLFALPELNSNFMNFHGRGVETGCRNFLMVFCACRAWCMTQAWDTIMSSVVMGRWNVFALDLKNEPHDPATWGAGNPSYDWNKVGPKH